MGDTPSVLVFNDKDDFNSNVLNSAFSSVDLRLRAVEGLNASYEDAINTLNQYGLQRLNDAMQPVYDQLVKISQIGVIFTTTSQTSAMIAQGPVTFIVTAGTARTQFAAAAFLQVRSALDPSIAMYGSTDSYNATTGELKLLITETSGTSATPINDWVISAAATPDLLTKAHDVGAYTMQEVNDLIENATGNIDLTTLLPLTGGTMTGDLTLGKGMLKLGTGQGTGAKNWNLTSTATGALVASLSDGTNQFVFGSDGTLKIPGITGDVKTYIDSGAANAAAAGTAAATAGLSGKLSKAGDTMSGALTVNGTVTINSAPLVVAGTNPYLDLVYGGVLRARWQVDSSGNMIYRNGDNGSNFFYISTNGAIWTSQFGDLNNRIEQRASDYANSISNACQHGNRWAYAGDLGNDWNILAGYIEPYNGAAMTTRASGFDTQSNQSVIGMRYRYLQLYIPNQGWINSYYG